MSSWFQMNMTFQNKFAVSGNHYRRTSDQWGECYSNPQLVKSMSSTALPPSSSYLPISAAKTPGQNGHTVAPFGYPSYGQMRTPAQKTSWVPQMPASTMSSMRTAGYQAPIATATKTRWPLGQLFAQFDTDSDGVLDMGEFKRALRAIGLPKRYGEKADLDEFTFKQMDTNGDGKLSPAEFDANLPAALRAKIEEKLDAGWVFDRKKWAESNKRHAQWDMQKVFKQFDIDSDGSIDIGELQRAFRALGLKKRSGAKMDVDQAMFNSFDTNGDGQISLEEFDKNMPPAVRAKIIEQLEAGWTFDPELWKASVARHAKPNYAKVFKQFDIDNDGFLDFREMQRAFRAIGLEKRNGGKYELDAMMYKAFDANGDGKVSLEEFEDNMPDSLREKLDEIISSGWKFNPAAWEASVARHAKDAPFDPSKAFANAAPILPRWPLGTVFMQFDTDNDGYLDMTEFKRALRAIGLARRADEKENLDEFTFKQMDTNGDGKLSPAEFDANMPLALREKIEDKLDKGWKFDEAKWAASVARHAEWDMKKVFKQFDIDSDGTIDIGELQRAFRALGLKKRDGHKFDVDQAMFNSFDTNGDGQISLEEFDKNMPPAVRAKIIDQLEKGWKFDPDLWSASSTRHAKPNYSKVFKKFDIDNDGFLDFREMQRAFRAIGLKKRDGGKYELDKMMYKAFDANGDGKVSLEEFEVNMPDSLREKLDEFVNGGWEFDANAWEASVARHAKDAPYDATQAFA